MEPETAGVIIDDTGQPLPPHPLYLAQRLGVSTGDFDVIAYAVKNLGFVLVTPLRGGLLVKFEPTTVHRLAAIAAFYEIAARPQPAPLSSPGSGPGRAGRLLLAARRLGDPAAGGGFVEAAVPAADRNRAARRVARPAFEHLAQCAAALAPAGQ